MNGSSSGKGTTTTTSQADPFAQQSYTALMMRANQLSRKPYEAYGGQLVAGLTPEQQEAFKQLQSAYGSQAPYIDMARQYATLGASPLQTSAIASYLNPYQDQVVKATMGQLENLEQANNAASMGQGLGAGGLFNDRLGVQQGQLANQEAVANAQTLGQLNTQNWAQAVANAQADRSAAAQGAYTFGNLGAENLQAILQGAGATLTAGNQEQQQRQQELNSLYNQWQIAKAYPYQQIAWATGIDTGLGSNMGGTSSTTAPPPNPLNAYGGLGLAAAGMGYNAYQGNSAFAAKGGRIPAFAGGGAPGIPGFEPDSGSSPAPYGGVKGFIPSVSLTRGSGPPKPPGAPKQEAGQMPKLPGGVGGGGGGGISPIANGISEAAPEEIAAGAGGADAAGALAGGAGDFIETMGPMLALALARGGGIDRAYAAGGGVQDDIGGDFDWGGTDPGAFSPNHNLGATGLHGGTEALPKGDLEHRPRYNGLGGDLDWGGHDPEAFSPQRNLGTAGLYGGTGTLPKGDLEGARQRFNTRWEGLGGPTFDDRFHGENPLRTEQDVPGYGEAPEGLPWPENAPAGSPRRPGGVPDGGFETAFDEEPEPVVGAGAHVGPDDTGGGDDTVRGRRDTEGGGGSNALGNALMAAGFGLMSSRSPYFGVAAGEAGMQGLGAYQGTKNREETRRHTQAKEALDQTKMEQQIKRLDQAAAQANRRLNLDTSKHAFEMAKPHVVAEDEYGKTYGVFNPESGQFDTIQRGNPLQAGRPGQAGTGQPGVTLANFSDDELRQGIQSLPEGMRPRVPQRDEEFLRSLPPQEAATVKGLADYRLNPASLSIKGGHRERLLGAAAQYDPEYQQALYPAKQKAASEFYAGGQQSPAGIMLNGNTALLHLGEMSDALEEMKAQPGILNAIGRQGIPFLSYIANQANQGAIRGTPAEAALQRFLASRQRYVEEVTKFYAGGQGTQAEREQALHVIDPNLSLPGLRATIAQDTKLMADKVSVLSNRLMQGMSPGMWYSAMKNDPSNVLIYRQAREAMQRVLSREQQGETPEQKASQATGVNPKALRFKGKLYTVNPATGRYEAQQEAQGIQP